MKNLSFSTKSLLVCALLLVVAFALSVSQLVLIPLTLYIVIMAYTIMSILLYKNLSKSNRENPKRFVSSFMGAIGIKLFTSLIFLVLYLFLVKDDTRIPVTIGLFIIYMIFTVLLIRQIMREIRENEKN